MKTTLSNLTRVVAVVTASMLIPGCDDNDNPNSASIAGKWKVELRELFDCPDPDDNEILTCNASSTSQDCGTWEFTTDGDAIFVYLQGGGGYTFQYETTGGGGLELCQSNACYPYAYTISGNTLVITQADLNSNTCRYKWTLVKN